MKANIDKYSVEAGKQRKLEEMKVLLDKANSFRGSVEQELKVVKTLEDASLKLEEQIKDLTSRS